MTKIKQFLAGLWKREQGTRFVRLFVSSLVAQVPVFAASGELKHFAWAPLGSLLVGAAETSYKAWRPSLTSPTSAP